MLWDHYVIILWCHYVTLCHNGMALFPYFMTPLHVDVIVLYYDIIMLWCLPYILMSLCYDTIVLWCDVISLHYYIIMTYHVTLWCHKIITLLRDLNDMITLWYPYLTLLHQSVMMSLAFTLMSLHCDTMVWHHYGTLWCHYIKLALICYMMMLMPYGIISICYASIITLCYDVITLF